MASMMNLGFGSRANSGAMPVVNMDNALTQSLSGQVNTATLDPVIANAQRRLGEQFNEQVLPGIRGGAMSAGQYGSSRQGIAEGLAARGLGYAMGDMSANLYNQAYQDAQNRMSTTANNMLNNQTQRYGIDQNNQTQRYGIDQTYNLGMTNANNNRYGMDLNFQNANLNRGENARQFDLTNELSRDQFGFNSALGLNTYLMNLNNMGLNAATNIQNQPLNYYNQFANTANSFAGQGGVTNQSMPGNPVMGAMGGYYLGSQIGRSPNATGGANTSGWGTGAGFGNQDYGMYF